jgi:2-polyprenyl-6-hydroxyphenyl methylase/3-demethylubiquinone-9 3-methyltransferase
MKGENRFKYIANYKSVRGMNWWNDVKDWLGGYPYEYAKAEAMVDYFRNNNYKVLKIKDCHNGIGCNEFLVKNSLL